MTSEEQAISGLTIRIDRTLCIGTGNCVAVAPEVFVLGDDQIVTFVEAPADIDRDRLIEACAVCLSMPLSPSMKRASRSYLSGGAASIP